MFIVLEGIDGTGKTTVAEILAKYFSYTSFELTQPLFRPFMDTVLGEVDPNVFHMLNMANLKHTSNLIDAEIALGSNVVCARYTPTTIGYHNVMAVRKGVSKLFSPSAEDYFVTKPDIIFHLTATEEVRQKRMNGRGRITSSDNMMDNHEIRKAILAEFNNMDMIELDTSYINPMEVAEKLLTYIETI